MRSGEITRLPQTCPGFAGDNIFRQNSASSLAAGAIQNCSSDKNGGCCLSRENIIEDS